MYVHKKTLLKSFRWSFVTDIVLRELYTFRYLEVNKRKNKTKDCHHWLIIIMTVSMSGNNWLQKKHNSIKDFFNSMSMITFKLQKYVTCPKHGFVKHTYSYFISLLLENTIFSHKWTHYNVWLDIGFRDLVLIKFKQKDI